MSYGRGREVKKIIVGPAPSYLFGRVGGRIREPICQTIPSCIKVVQHCLGCRSLVSGRSRPFLVRWKTGLRLQRSDSAHAKIAPLDRFVLEIPDAQVCRIGLDVEYLNTGLKDGASNDNRVLVEPICPKRSNSSQRSQALGEKEV